jgi:hypothetical protein
MVMVPKTYRLLEEAIDEGIRGFLMNEDLEIALKARLLPEPSTDANYEHLVEEAIARIMLAVDERFDFTEFEER